MIRPAHDVAIGGIAIFVCWCAAVALAPETVTTAASEPPPAGPAVVVTTPARRIGDMQQVTPTVPAPYQWPGDLPHAPYAPACDRQQATLVALAMRAEGANDDSVLFMLRTISRESGCRHWVRNNNPSTGDDSFSLCQLNARAGHFGPNGVLAGWDRWRMLDDFVYAAQGCARMWSVCGRGPWQPPYGCSVPGELR
jgi:hypothetical protein